MLRVFVGLATLLGIISIATGPAQAFVDCKTPQFAAEATDGETRAAGQPAFVCQELKTANIVRGNVSVALRVVNDATGSQKLRQAYADIAADAADEAIENWAKYGGWSGGEVTIALLDGVLGNDEGLFATTYMSNAGYCIVQISVPTLENYPARQTAKENQNWGDIDALQLMRRTIIHELFHCVQFWTNRPGTDAKGTDWWVEGSPEAAANAVVPITPDVRDMYQAFNERIGYTPLTGMKYEATVFFDWLWTRDPALVFKVIREMPAKNGRAAQQKAIEGILPAGIFDEFARDYVDGKAKNAQGDQTGFPNEPAAKPIASSGTIKQNALPFTIVYRRYSLIGGAFSLAGKSVWVRREAGGEWGVLDAMAAPACDAPDLYRAAGMPTGEGEPGVAFDLYKECDQVALTEERPSCLVGRWQLDTKRLAQDMAASIPNNRTAFFYPIVLGQAFMEVQGDGKMLIAFTNLNFYIGLEEAGGLVGIFIHGTDTYGWSASGTHLSVVPYDRGAKIVIALATKGAGVTVSDHEVFAAAARMPYSCSDALDVEMTRANVGYKKNPRWHFTRLGPSP